MIVIRGLLAVGTCSSAPPMATPVTAESELLSEQVESGEWYSLKPTVRVIKQLWVKPNRTENSPERRSLTDD